jgi:hypothetical protein
MEMEQELARQLIVLGSKVTYLGLIGILIYIFGQTLRDYADNIRMYIKMRFSDHPMYSPSERSKVRIKEQGEWWMVMDIGNPFFGDSQVHLKRENECEDPNDKNCNPYIFIDIAYPDYYRTPREYK